MRRWIVSVLIALVMAVGAMAPQLILSCDAMPDWLQQALGCQPAGGGGSGAGH